MQDIRKTEDLSIMLGIIGAMEEEVSELVMHMTDREVTAAAGMRFFRGKLGQKAVEARCDGL